MMKGLSMFFILTFGTNCVAQMIVSSTGYIFARDQMIYVKQGIDMNVNGAIYLRENAQLLQGSAGSSTNTGAGELSVFQEGTVDNFEYNYWCSPVGNSSAAVGNENFGISMFQRPLTLTTSAPAVILANNVTDGIALPLEIAPMWIYKFLMGLNYSEWIPVFNTPTIAPGQGFTMKGTSGIDATVIFGVPNNPGSAQRYDFRGKPNDGDIDVVVANGQYTLTGNPYPSAMDLSAFLTEALNCTGIAYFWEQDKTVNSHLITAYRGGYGTYSPMTRGGTGIYVPAAFYAYAASGAPLSVQSTPMNSYARYFSPIGQGFMIQGNGAGPNVTIKNSYRVFQKENAALSVFERSSGSKSITTQNNLDPVLSVSGFDYTEVSAKQVQQIRFNAVLNGLGFRQFVVALDEAATDGIDHAMDARMPAADLPADVFLSIGDGEYVISAIDFSLQKRLPLGLKCVGKANFKIAVSEMLNCEEVEHVFIHDKVTGIYHDIKSNIFEMTMPPGISTDRFEITFTDAELGTSPGDVQGLTILQDNPNQMLLIDNPQQVAIQSVELYDLAGKLVSRYDNVGITSELSYPTSSFAEGLYLVKITAVYSELSKKIIVRR